MKQDDDPTPDCPERDGPVVKIGDLARSAGVTPRTVRFYEEQGLLEPARRTTGGFRLYSAAQVDRLRAVLALKEVGFSLEDIRAYRGLAVPGHVAFEVMARLRGRVATGARHLRARLQRLQLALRDLERAEEVLAACNGCEGKGYDDACHGCWRQLAGGCVPDALNAVT